MTRYKLGEEEVIGEHQCPNCGQINDVAAALTENDVPDNRELSEGDLLICTRCGHLMTVDEDLLVRDLTSEERDYWANNPEFKVAREILKEALVNKGPLKH